MTETKSPTRTTSRTTRETSSGNLGSADSPTPFDRILIANRGEIACRIIRTAQGIGLKTIAVYSEADAQAPHVKMADEAVLIGPAPVAESYLSIKKILDAARKTGAEAIHPGYGFLSENATFAKECATSSLVFIGPNIEAIDIMGDKAKSKRRMLAAGVPCIPGYQGEDQSTQTLLEAAQKIGVPLMVKAAAGGGGRGMRLVEGLSTLEDALAAARSEAENAFSSGDLILERAILEPRHVEIQIFADKFGHCIHLGERDCSVQRRHQKVLEEAPCPVMTPELREEMGAAAIRAAQDIGYIGAGTVEFLLDTDNSFYFLEMNTRLQVEHPVTEMVTGLDLVALQIRIARGERLDLVQDDICLTGYAIEARLYAEDPAQGFLPATGPIDLWSPDDGVGIRIDDGIATGGEISPFYDPMIAKVIAHGQSREEARLRLIKALKNTALFGVTTNKSFLIDALGQPDFAQGIATTAFIARNFSSIGLARPRLSLDHAAIGAILLFETAQQTAVKQAGGIPDELLNWSSASAIQTPYRFVIGSQKPEADPGMAANANDGNENKEDKSLSAQTTDTATADIESTLSLGVIPLSPARYEVVLFDEAGEAARVIEVEILSRQTDNTVNMTLDGARHHILFNIPITAFPGQTVQFTVDGADLTLTNLNGIRQNQAEAAGAGAVIAPMHGLLLEVFATEGAEIATGDRLAILEAMKMQHELRAEVDGIVKAVYFDAGIQIAADALLMEIEPQE